MGLYMKPYESHLQEQRISNGDRGSGGSLAKCSHLLLFPSCIALEDLALHPIAIPSQCSWACSLCELRWALREHHLALRHNGHNERWFLGLWKSQ